VVCESRDAMVGNLINYSAYETSVWVILTVCIIASALL